MHFVYQFFAEFNSKLLSSSNYIIRRQAIQVYESILPVILCCYLFLFSPLNIKFMEHSLNFMFPVKIFDSTISTLRWFVDLVWVVLGMSYVFQLLGDILMERSNMTVMVWYVSSKEHLIILMNLLRVRYSYFLNMLLNKSHTLSLCELICICWRLHGPVWLDLWLFVYTIIWQYQDKSQNSKLKAPK